jgi:hypothetical protein
VLADKRPTGVPHGREGCRLIESDTSRHNDSYPGKFTNINRRYVSIGVEGPPIRGSKNGTNGVQNAGSSNDASTRASSPGSCCNSSGRSDSHYDG